MNERRPWHDMAWVAVFLLALVLRLGVATQYEEHHPLADRPVIDELSYDEWAREIAAGDWVGDEVFFQEPLYPYWLATVYSVVGSESRTGVRYVQAFLGALTALFVGLFTRRLFGTLAGFVAGLAMATHRTALLFPALLLKPNLVLPILGGLLLVLAAARRREQSQLRSWPLWVGVGALAGAGALLRGNVLLLLPALCLLPFLRARLNARPVLGAWRDAAACMLGIALLLGPVAVRNASVGGAFVLTTSGAGTNVYGGNNEHNLFGRATEFPWVRGIPKYEADDWRREAERRLQRSLEPNEVSRYWLAETGRSLIDRPGLHARILWNKLRLTLGAYEVPDNHHVDWDARYVPLLRPWPGFAWWGTLGVAGVLLFVLHRPLRTRLSGSQADAWECLGLLALYVATIVVTVTSMRARLAIVPMLFPFAGAFVAVLAGREARREAGWRAMVALGVAALIVLWPVFSAEERRTDLDKRDFNQAIYLLQAGDVEGAGALAKELDRRQPNSSRVFTLLAQIDFERGADLRAGHAAGSDEEIAGRSLIQTALERLKAVCTKPGIAPREVHRARLVSAHIQQYLGNFRAAENHYREALTFDAENVDTLVGLASALLANANAADDEQLAVAARDEALALLEGVLARGAGPPGLEARVELLRGE